jgi:hypothetical protein
MPVLAFDFMFHRLSPSSGTEEYLPIALDGLFSYILVILYVVSKGRHYLCLFIYSHTIHL